MGTACSSCLKGDETIIAQPDIVRNSMFFQNERFKCSLLKTKLAKYSFVRQHVVKCKWKRLRGGDKKVKIVE